MKPEKENLIHELLGGDSNRETILATGNRVLRRRRQWRVARQVLAVLVLIGAIGVFYLRRETQSPALPVASQNLTKKPVSGPQVSALTDDELLGLFTNTPVGLASLPGGKKLLIFPRPGDEQKFITKL
jgi:hypothetical protein